MKGDSNLIELVLEYYTSDFRDVSDIADNIIDYGGITIQTYHYVMLSDFGLDKNSKTLKKDIQKVTDTIIKENKALFMLVDEIVTYCDKNRVKLTDVRVYDDKLDFTFDNFTSEELSEIRSIIYTVVDKNDRVSDEYLSGDGRNIVVRF